MTETIAGFNDLMAEKASLEEKIRDKGKDLFHERTKEIFEKHGDIVDTFGWAQYTPYFNDGEPCEFSVYDLFIWSKNDRKSEDFEENYYESADDFSTYGIENNKLERYFYNYKYEYQPSSWGTEAKKPVEIRETTTTWEPNQRTKVVDKIVNKIENPSFDPKYGEAYEEITALYKTIDKDTLKHLFGDHCVVLVTANGVEVEEHEHE